MSIAGGAGYYERMAEILDCTIINRAINGAVVYTSDYANGLANKALAGTLLESGYTSYEDRLLGFKTAGGTDYDYNDIDLFIIDMGVNDFASTTATYDGTEDAINVVSGFEFDKTHNYAGAYNFILREMYKLMPKCKILMVNHMEKVYRKGAYLANNNVQKFWNLPISNYADVIGLNLNEINGVDTDNLFYWVGDSSRLHPYAYPTEYAEMVARAIIPDLKKIG